MDQITIVEPRLIPLEEPREWAESLRIHGWCALRDPVPAARDVLSWAGECFKLPDEVKASYRVGAANPTRGHSFVKTARDFREQYQFVSPWASSGARYEPLWGPNLWPEPLGSAFVKTMEDYFFSVIELGHRIGRALSHEFNLPLRIDNQGMHLLKMIHYPRTQGQWGLAPHCDWSWFTITISSGDFFEVFDLHSKKWVSLLVPSGTVMVHLGELIELLSGGELKALPHRVKASQGRCSIPIFINPALEEIVVPSPRSHESGVHGTPEHVHRVASDHFSRDAFLFGESEWRRKIQGQWCHDEHCLEPAIPRHQSS